MTDVWHDTCYPSYKVCKMTVTCTSLIVVFLFIFLYQLFLIVITSGNINSVSTDMCLKQNEENKRSIPAFVVMSQIDIHVVYTNVHSMISLKRHL